ncbi:C40 family peptidase [Paenibacillus phocaensis]|uniref:C40 family peptidase n=1 Tax=Paenibacillus phocaensis TaxID=1776378 RepID=UPI000839C80C|nr:stalk domain-containing protein [Paenibacillus phocaensis]
MTKPNNSKILGFTWLLAASLILSAEAGTAGAEPAGVAASGAGTKAASPTPQTASISTGRIAIELDGKLLQPKTPPTLVNGSVLLPIRDVFEALGAKLGWDDASKTVTATKGPMTLVYRIGDTTAQLNGQTLTLPVPGQIKNGYTLVPLRFVSEALGCEVVWDGDHRTVRITSTLTYETTVAWGVNLRSAPDASSEAVDEELLPAGSKLHVVREAGALWLEVRTPDGRSGYVSAKPKYTDYRSNALADKQADELIAYGKTFEGTPYEFGASPDQTKTFDCSSFVKRVYGDILSIELPRVSYNQAKEGTEVGLDELRKGDLLFFSARGLDIGHVGIYIGDDQILHTYSKEQGVHIEAFDGQWKKRFVTARRVF